MTDLHEERMALISMLTKHSPRGHIGRTAVMKYLYFLQTLRSVPLGYRFTLYSYGPFDSDVLADLAAAESLGVVNSSVVQYPGGYGYEITAGANAGWLEDRSKRFLRKCKPEVQWVIEKFGVLSSAKLELVSTIIYVDREAADDEEELSLDALAAIVKEVKPHFSMDEIMTFASRLRDEDLLEAAA